MARIDPPEPMKTEDVFLHALKVAARSELSPQLAHDMEARAWYDNIADRMVFELRTQVYAEKVAVDSQRVPFSKSAPYSQTKIEHFTPPRAFLLVVFPIIFALGMLAALNGIGALAAVAVAVAAFALWGSWAKLAPVEREITIQGVVDVKGDVTMHADYWRTFPDNARAFPKEFGNAVRIVMPSEPTIYYEGQ